MKHAIDCDGSEIREGDTLEIVHDVALSNFDGVLPRGQKLVGIRLRKDASSVEAEWVMLEDCCVDLIVETQYTRRVS